MNESLFLSFHVGKVVLARLEQLHYIQERYLAAESVELLDPINLQRLEEATRFLSKILPSFDPTAELPLQLDEIGKWAQQDEELYLLL